MKPVGTKLNASHAKLCRRSFDCALSPVSVALLRLHRAAYTCSQELCLGQPTTKWLEWCINRCQLLLHHKVIPVLVFDGGRLPEKDKTEKSRRESE